MRRFYRVPDEKWGFANRVDLKVRELLQPRRERENPRLALRPNLPPVLVFGLVFWLAVALAYEGLFYVREYAALAVVVSILLLAAVVGHYVRQQRRGTGDSRRTGKTYAAGKSCVTRAPCEKVGSCGTGAACGKGHLRDAVLLVVAALLTGCFFASVSACGLMGECASVEDGVKVVGFRMLEDASSGNYGGYGDAVAFDEKGHAYDVRVLLSSSEDLPMYGETFSCTGSVVPAEEAYALSNWENGLCGSAEVYNVTRVAGAFPLEAVVSLRKSAVEAIQTADGLDDAKAVLEALVCGYRVELYQSDVYDDFKIAGLAHLVAVSGAHLSLVCMMAGWALRKMRLRKKAVIVAQVAVLVGFLAFSAFPVSAVRAALMSVACLASSFTQRRSSTLNALGVCILCIVALSPTAALSISFVLSVTSVLGIALFTRLFQSWTEAGSDHKSRMGAIVESVSLTFSASILSTPVSACMFSQVPLVSPLANMAAAPLFTAVCGLGLVGSLMSVAAPFFGAFVLKGALALCSVLCAIVSLLASIPYASIPFFGNVSGAILISTLIAVALWLFWPRFKLASLGVAAAVVVLVVVVGLTGQTETSGVQIVALNVGQGDAILVRDRDNVVLVDTGREDQMLLAALARQGVYHIDAVVITHGDDDHMGSLDALRGVVQVDRVIVCAFAKDCSCDNCEKLVRSATDLVGKDKVVGAKVGTKITCGAWSLSVIWPDAFTDEGGNADSLTMLATADVDSDGKSDARALLVGDCEDDQLDQMIELNKVSTVDIYKVGHHGSRKAIDVDTARELSPKISLVSVGANNKYGHPVSTTLDALRQAGSAIYRTDQSGDVACNVFADKVSVTTQD